MLNPNPRIRPARRESRGFTLVELLVVIGIIAILIAILLPALNRAKRQANSAKCAAAMRDLGNAFNLYALDNRGFMPPTQLRLASGRTYTLDASTYPLTGSGGELVYPYWTNFLARYVTKNKVGGEATDGIAVSDARKTVLWGCPNWEGDFTGTIVDGISRVQTGYAMNAWPTFSATNPAGVATNYPLARDRNFIENWPLNTAVGRFQLQKLYQRQGDQRALLMDSRHWGLSADRVTGTVAAPNYPGHVLYSIIAGSLAPAAGDTTADLFRHGRPPAIVSPTPGDGTYAATGGQPGYNVLWSDGHVTSENTRPPAWKGVRMRFPG